MHIFVAQRRKAIFGKIRAMAACQRCELNNLDGRVGIAHDEAAFRGCFHRIGPGRARRRLNGRNGRSEEHTSELQSLMRISYAVFCLKKKNKPISRHTTANTSCIHTTDNKNKYR